MNLVELFCQVDDFCQAFEGSWIRHQLTTGHRRRRRAGQLCLSEIMTLLIWFHQSHYRDFKAFYQHHVCKHLRGAFPGLVSYGRFVELCILEEASNQVVIMMLGGDRHADRIC